MLAVSVSKCNEHHQGASRTNVLCRTHKRKCRPHDKDNAPCKRCLHLNLACSFVETPTTANNPGSALLGDEAGFFPPHVVCNELVDLYFDIIHDKDHILFHRPSFISAQRRGVADMMHVSAMMALAARYATAVPSDWPAEDLEYEAVLVAVGCILTATVSAQVFYESMVQKL